MDYIRNHYENYDEDSRLTTNYGRIEFLTTMRYIERYLLPGVNILEVGCATGRYSLALAEAGYAVAAVDLLEHHLSILRSKATPAMRIKVYQGNALDLGFLPASEFDVTLLLGPMYHLYTREDALQALKEAVRVTRPGGHILVAYCLSDATLLQYGFFRDTGVDERIISSVDASWKLRNAPEEVFALVRSEDIFDLDSALPVCREAFVATDGFSSYYRDKLAAMDECVFQQYLAYHLSTCERRDLVGASNHVLDVLRKQ